jgi:hypothetical protein
VRNHLSLNVVLDIYSQEENSIIKEISCIGIKKRDLLYTNSVEKDT